MNTMQSRPKSAAAVAVATPCWPAPVSAMTRRLPMRRVSSAWPSTLLILCEPVWVRSSRLRSTRSPRRSDSRWHSVTGVGRPAYEVSSSASSARNASSTHARRNSSSSSMQRGHERLGHEAPAELAEAAEARRLGARRRELHRRAAAGAGPGCGSDTVVHPVVRRGLRVGHPPVARLELVTRLAAALMKLRSLRASFTPLPGVVSTPVATSTPHGRTRWIACATFPGCSPPASRSRTPAGTASASAQSNATPEPGSSASTSTMSTGPLPTAARAGSSAAKPWITNGTRRRIHRTSESGSRPWSCAPESPSVLTISTTRS